MLFRSEVSLIFRTAGKEEIKKLGIMKPVFRDGLSFHLTMSKRQSGSGKNPTLTLIIKDDPGIAIILKTFAVMIVLMLWYYAYDIKFLRRPI